MKVILGLKNKIIKKNWKYRVIVTDAAFAGPVITRLTYGTKYGGNEMEWSIKRIGSHPRFRLLGPKIKDDRYFQYPQSVTEFLNAIIENYPNDLQLFLFHPELLDGEYSE